MRRWTGRAVALAFRAPAARVLPLVLALVLALFSLAQLGGCGAAAGPNSGELMFDFGDDEPDAGAPDAANPYDATDDPAEPAASPAPLEVETPDAGTSP